MPRTKDPIASLNANRERQDALEAKQERLRTDAALFLGNLMLKGGLDNWSSKDLKLLITRAGESGAEKALAALSGRTAPRSAEGEEGDDRRSARQVEKTPSAAQSDRLV